MDPWEDLTKLLVAVAVGGVIGAERQLSDKPAGFRTMILICVGATLYTLWSVRIAGDSKDPGRIAAQIVTGVGFLGAGAILRDKRAVFGLTTAAAIWLVAALGVGIGLGQYRTVLPAAFIVLFILLVLQRLDRWLDGRRDDHVYEITIGTDSDDLHRVRQLFKDAGLKLISFEATKTKEGRSLTFRAVGSPAQHQHLGESLLAEALVLEMSRD